MINKSLFSSDKSTWTTPKDLFEKLNAEFGFTVDVCATKYNALCNEFISPERDFLKQSFNSTDVCYMNPPYGRNMYDFIRHAYEQNKLKGTKFVILIPSRTDTKWFHDFIYNKHEIRFIKGRLKFGESKNSAPFPSMIVVMDKHLEV